MMGAFQFKAPEFTPGSAVSVTFSDKMNAIPEMLKRKLDLISSEIAKVIRFKLSGNPINPLSGLLLESVTETPAFIFRGNVIAGVTVGNDSFSAGPYGSAGISTGTIATILERGSSVQSPYDISPRPENKSQRLKFIAKDGTEIHTTHVTHPPIQRYAYAESTLEDAKPWIEQELAGVLAGKDEFIELAGTIPISTIPSVTRIGRPLVDKSLSNMVRSARLQREVLRPMGARNRLSENVRRVQNRFDR